VTQQQALTGAIQVLRAADIPLPERDARVLMAHALGVERSRLTLHMQDDLPPEKARYFEAMIADRSRHMPVSHIIGGRWFYGRWFRVTGDVLDPRPETETLINLALAKPFSNLLDLGSGSGAIIVTLLAERSDAVGIATDISGAALDIARENAAASGVADRIGFAVSDWFSALDGQFDLIVSNPPYIAAAEMPGLQPDVRDFEPRFALTDEADGLSAYRRIARGLGRHLHPNGRVIVEIGPNQAKAVTGFFADAGLENITVHTDLDGRDRVISAIKPA